MSFRFLQSFNPVVNLRLFVVLSLLNNTCIVVLLLHTAWHMTREDMLAIKELRGEDKHDRAYWSELKAITVEEDNIIPVLVLSLRLSPSRTSMTRHFLNEKIFARSSAWHCTTSF